MSDQKQKDMSLNGNSEMTHEKASSIVSEYAVQQWGETTPKEFIAKGFLLGEKSVYSSPEIRNLIDAAKTVNEVWTRDNLYPEVNHLGDDVHDAWRKIKEALTAIERKRGEMGK